VGGEPVDPEGRPPPPGDDELGAASRDPPSWSADRRATRSTAHAGGVARLGVDLARAVEQVIEAAGAACRADTAHLVRCPPPTADRRG
jgi:hypothetical protein